MGLITLLTNLAATLVLMTGLYLLSGWVLHFGFLPISSALSLSGFNRLIFYFLLLPGTIIHEISHLIACLVVGVRVRDVQLFSPQPDGRLAWVTHATTDPIRRAWISLAPFFGGSLFLFWATRAAFPSLDVGQVNGVAGAWGSLGEMVRLVVSTLAGADWQQASTWLWLYLTFSLAYSIAPSRLDLIEGVRGGIVIGVVAALLALMDSVAHWSLASNPQVNQIASGLAGLLAGLNLLLLFSLVLIGLSLLVLVPMAALASWIRGG